MLGKHSKLLIKFSLIICWVAACGDKGNDSGSNKNPEKSSTSDGNPTPEELIAARNAEAISKEADLTMDCDTKACGGNPTGYWKTAKACADKDTVGFAEWENTTLMAPMKAKLTTLSITAAAPRREHCKTVGPGNPRELT